MEIDLKESLKMERERDMVSVSTPMEVNMKVIIRRTSHTEKVFTHGKTEKCMKASGKMVFSMGWV